MGEMTAHTRPGTHSNLNKYHNRCNHSHKAERHSGRRMQRKSFLSLTTLIPAAALLIGICLILYPVFSNYWNTLCASRAISSYTQKVEELDPETCRKMLEQARAYNESIVKLADQREMDDERTEEYNSLLDLAGDGVMGYVDIPSIDVQLPIYHGTEEGVLQEASGHLNWSSLPTGGEDSHTVLAGHRGLPSSKLFSDLDELKEGDTFTLHILNITLTYQIDQILVVLPNETDNLLIQSGEDLCTLLTCTPYGINSHRLLVRGRRVES